jgi:hypothetical protein
MRFNRALLERDAPMVNELADPSVTVSGEGSLPMPTTATATGVHVQRVRVAQDDQLVVFDCGPEVADRTLSVTLLDGTGTVSAGGVRYYLVLRSEGWRVWGSY